MNTENETIELRIKSNKEKLVEQLGKIPIAELACKKVGVGRSTYYRWRQDDKEFLKQCNEAIEEGAGLISDMAESQLINAIKEGNMAGITFWLKHRHPAYKNRVELTAPSIMDENLTDEQKKIVEQALLLGSITSKNKG